MAACSIAVIPGDGIGQEVIPSTMRVLDRAVLGTSLSFEWNVLDWNCQRYLTTGKLQPDDAFEILARHKAVLFGAIGDPRVPDTVPVHTLLLPMRRHFDQYVNLRPSYLYPGVESPLRDKAPGSIDLLFYRENTEGEYAPLGGKQYPGTPEEIAVQVNMFTRRGCERIIRAAFQAAEKRPRKKLTSITKSNALSFSMTLWDDAFHAVKKDFPNVQASSLLVDAAAMDLVRKPEAFDVMVASNLFGDILTDLAAMVTGTIGLAASANINPEGKFPSMFEPVHGSAPDIAGKGISNPLAAILSGAMMLDHLGQVSAGDKVRAAVHKVLSSGSPRTPDLGGTDGTTAMEAAVLAAL